MTREGHPEPTPEGISEADTNAGKEVALLDVQEVTTDSIEAALDALAQAHLGAVGSSVWEANRPWYEKKLRSGLEDGCRVFVAQWPGSGPGRQRNEVPIGLQLDGKTIAAGIENPAFGKVHGWFIDKENRYIAGYRTVLDTTPPGHDTNVALLFIEPPERQPKEPFDLERYKVHGPQFNASFETLAGPMDEATRRILAGLFPDETIDTQN